MPSEDASAPPKLDAQGRVVISDELKALLDKKGIIATEPAGSVRPCFFDKHKDVWFKRPWPMGDMACPICHPPIGSGAIERNHEPAPYVGRPVAPRQPDWMRPTSDLAGQQDPSTILFNDDALNG